VPVAFHRFLFASAFAGAATLSSAAEIRLEEKTNPASATIHISGNFLRQDFHRLDALLEQIEKRSPRAVVTLTLDSPGGAHFEGLRTGLLVHRKGIGTRILPGSTCFSACASIFFGGFDRKAGKPNRVAHEGARLGVHRMAHVSGPKSEAIERRVRAAAEAYLADIGVSEKIRRMFLQTGPQDMYVLTPSDMAESDITFVRSAKGDAQTTAWAHTHSRASADSDVILASQHGAPEGQVRQGDRWVYEGRNEITGQRAGIVTWIVTEVNDKEYVVGLGNKLVVYDHQWNRVEDPPWRFSPHDGLGIPRPLQVGTEVAYEGTHELDPKLVQPGTTPLPNPVTFKVRGSIKVAAQERATIKTATCETYRVETTFEQTPIENPSQVTQNRWVFWYAPAVNHWVKRTFESRQQGRLRTNISEELIDYGRRQQQ
jgi:hypothetical protein